MYLLFVQLRRWKIINVAKRIEQLFSSQSIVSSVKTSMQAQRPGRNSFWELQRRKKRSRTLQRISFYTSGFWTAVLFFQLIYHSLVYQGRSRARGFIGADICYALSAVAVMWGLNSWMAAVFYSLPDVLRYGRLLQIDSILVNHPSFLPLAVVITSSFSTIVFFVIGVILPQVNPRKRLEADLALHGFMILSFSVTFIYAFIFGTNIKRIFKKIIQACTAAREANGPSVFQNISNQEIEFVKVRADLLSTLLAVYLVSQT